MPKVKKDYASLVSRHYTLGISLCNQLNFFSPSISASNIIQNIKTNIIIIFNLEDDWHTTCSINGVTIRYLWFVDRKYKFNSDSFYADIAGSGDIAIKVSANRLESNISGSGSIHLSGSANSYDATITGSGDVDAFELRARDSSVVITGSGNCRLSVSDKLRAKITGSGDVLYKGYPEINQTITGSGSVKDRNWTSRTLDSGRWSLDFENRLDFG